MGLYFGSMMNSGEGNGWETAWVRNMLGSEFNLLMPGNQLKWQVIHPGQDTFNFNPGDLLVDFAVAHNMKVQGHILLRACQSRVARERAGTEYTKFSGQELAAILVNHIRTVMGHYRDKYPGVVNGGMSLMKSWDGTINSILTASCGPKLALILIEPITCAWPFGRLGQLTLMPSCA